jgi:hypothetical protein
VGFRGLQQVVKYIIGVLARNNTSLPVVLLLEGIVGRLFIVVFFLIFNNRRAIGWV